MSLKSIVSIGCTAMVVVAVLGNVAFANPPGFGPAPEMDPGSLASALTLLTGGFLVLRGRNRR